MTNDYVSTLLDLPPKHRGLLLEQLHLAAVTSTFLMRGLGLSLPGDTKVPTQAEVFDHLSNMTSFALEGYRAAAAEAPETVRADDITGDSDDALFSIEVSGLAKAESDGYSVAVDLNLLYGSNS